MMPTMTQDAPTSAQRRVGGGSRGAARRIVRLVASIVRVITVVFAFVLVIHVVLSVAGANPANGIAIFFRERAAQLTLGIGDLFLPASENLRVLLNFGLAAVLWLVIGIVLSKIILALSPR